MTSTDQQSQEVHVATATSHQEVRVHDTLWVETVTEVSQEGSGSGAKRVEHKTEKRINTRLQATAIAAVAKDSTGIVKTEKTKEIKKAESRGTGCWILGIALSALTFFVLGAKIFKK